MVSPKEVILELGQVRTAKKKREHPTQKQVQEHRHRMGRPTGTTEVDGGKKDTPKLPLRLAQRAWMD